MECSRTRSSERPNSCVASELPRISSPMMRAAAPIPNDPEATSGTCENTGARRASRASSARKRSRWRLLVIEATGRPCNVRCNDVRPCPSLLRRLGCSASAMCGYKHRCAILCSTLYPYLYYLCLYYLYLYCLCLYYL
jgi:hypothetical protein